MRPRASRWRHRTRPQRRTRGGRISICWPLARALSASNSRHRSRISGSCSSASNSIPLLSAPTGDSRSWHRREQTGWQDRRRSCGFGWPINGLSATRLESRKTAPISMPWPGGRHLIEVALGAEHAGWRLDRALAATLPSLSRERLKVLVKSGALTARTARPCAIRRSRSTGGEVFALAIPEPEPAHNEAQADPPGHRLRGRASAGDRQARRAGGPSGGGQSRRHLGQRLAPPLRGQPVGDRRRRPAGDRPSHRQGHVRADAGRQE